MNAAGIKSIVDSTAWPDVVEIMKKELDRPLSLHGLSVTEIGEHYLALQLAKDRFDLALSALRVICDQEQREKTSYK